MVSFRIIDFAWGLVVAVGIITIFTTNSSVSNEMMPTIINGLTTSISLILGFTAATVGFTFSNPLFKNHEGSELYRYALRAEATMFLLGAVVFDLFLAYYTIFTSGDFQFAFKACLIGLLIAMCNLLNLLMFIAVSARARLIGTIRHTRSSPQ